VDGSKSPIAQSMGDDDRITRLGKNKKRTTPILRRVLPAAKRYPEVKGNCRNPRLHDDG
jgi:hypothetical protein